MPTSNNGNKQPTIDILKRNNVNAILELGVGYGDCGYLIGEAIKNCKIFGIEIFKPYLENIPEGRYIKIFNEDMRFFDYDNFIKQQKVDAIIALDSIEHLNKNDGIKLLSKLETLTKLIIVSVPIIDCQQGIEFGNEWEEHKAQWTPEELINLGYTLEFKNSIIGVFYKKCVKKWEKKASLCYITWNRFLYTKKSLLSIIENTKRNNYDLNIWDNGSTDEGMVDWLRNISLNNNFSYMFFRKNQGLTRAMNNQMRIMQKMFNPDVFCHISNDIVVPPDWLNGVFEAIESSKVGAVGLNLENKISESTLVDGVELEKICDDGCIGGMHYCIPKHTYNILGGFREVVQLYGQQDANYSLQIKLLPLDIWDYYLPLKKYKGEHLGETGKIYDQYESEIRERLRRSGDDRNAGRSYRDQLRSYKEEFDRGKITAEQLIAKIKDDQPPLLVDKSQIQETNIMEWIEDA